MLSRKQTVDIYIIFLFTPSISLGEISADTCQINGRLNTATQIKTFINIKVIVQEVWERASHFTCYNLQRTMVRSAIKQQNAVFSLFASQACLKFFIISSFRLLFAVEFGAEELVPRELMVAFLSIGVNFWDPHQIVTVASLQQFRKDMASRTVNESSACSLSQTQKQILTVVENKFHIIPPQTNQNLS